VQAPPLAPPAAIWKQLVLLMQTVDLRQLLLLVGVVGVVLDAAQLGGQIGANYSSCVS
jgi:hypothetical protein